MNLRGTPVRVPPEGGTVTASIDHHRQAFASNPEDTRAFEALEEEFFIGGKWEELAAIYQHRLSAELLREDKSARVSMLMRLGQVLEERCFEIDQAVGRYWEAARIDPGHRPALQQLRQIHASRRQWDMVLQIAEMEAQAPMKPFERATFLTELSQVWLDHLHDPNEARSCLMDALEANPANAAALSNLARAEESLGRLEEAAGCWERAIDILRGPDRAAPLVSLAGLLAGPLNQKERAVECHRRALGDDPNNEDALEFLIVEAKTREQWPLLADLYERRFSLAAGARRRTAVALEAGHMHLRQLDDPRTARMWFERCLELCPEDVSVHQAMAELERQQGDSVALCRSLDRIIETTDSAAPPSTLLEAAELHSKLGEEEPALAHLERAREQSPDDPLILEALSDTLSKLGRAAELSDVLERRAALAAGDPEVQAEALATLGRVYEEDLDDPETAQSAYARAFQANPNSPGIAAKLEQLYSKSESWNELRSLLERASLQGPEAERVGFWCSLGEILRSQFGDVAESSRAFEAALELEPSCGGALQGLARVAVESGDEDAVLRSYEREATVTEDSARLSFLVGELVPLLENRNRPEDALSWLEKLLRIEPDDRSTLEMAARLREQLGLEEELIATLEHLDEFLLGSDLAANRCRLAALHATAGSSETAIQAYESALLSDPNNIRALAALRENYEATRDAESLTRVLRRLADLQDGADRVQCLSQLSTLLEEHLGDLEAAIVVLWRLVELDGRPADTDDRLEALLERTSRFEELAERLLERRRCLSDEDDEADELDLKCGQLLLDRLGQAEQAAVLFRALHEREPSCSQAAEGLERALRVGNDTTGLVAFLAEMAADESDPSRRADFDFERAVLLEEALRGLSEARSLYASLADDTANLPVATQASCRLERLLESAGDWVALRARLESDIGRGTAEDDLQLHERIAALCRDRLADRDGCATHLEQAGRLRPDLGHIWRSLALIYQEQGSSEDLLRVLEAELATGPDPQRELLLRVRAARLWTEQSDAESRAHEHYERALELDPGHPEAAEHLIDHYESEGRDADLIVLLERRLEALSGPSRETASEQSGPEAGDPNQPRRTSLRLRLAALRAGSADDLAGAIAALKPALEEIGPSAVVTEPLADLYARAGDFAQLADLCRRAGTGCETPAERAGWLLRQGDALRRLGDERGAIDAYRGVLEQRPDDQHARTALGELYRSQDEPESLIKLLESELEYLDIADQTPLRVEVARLLEERLDQPERALHHLQQVIAGDSDCTAVFPRAVDLADRLGRHEDLLHLIEASLEHDHTPGERGALLERSADLLAGPLHRSENAVNAYREALTLDPDLQTARQSMRRELQKLGHWPAVLDCLYVEAQRASSEGRPDIFEQAVEIAGTHLGLDGTLPWLERLRAERPNDPGVVARIADAHRQAGRPEALLRALEDELSLESDSGRKRDLHMNRALALERDLCSPGRAISALEAARELAPQDPEVLRELDRLYELTDRAKDRVEVIEARIDVDRTADPVELHRIASALCTSALADPERAVAHLLKIIDLTRATADPDGDEHTLPASERAGLLRQLGDTLRTTGRLDAWARAAESELALLVSTIPGDEEARATRDNRRVELHRELARTCDRDLGDPDAAIRHLHILIDEFAADGPGATCGTTLGDVERNWVEASLIRLLRADGNHVELEQRLTRRLSRGDGDADEWLELARLRQERLHAPMAAARAYRAALARRPSSLAAVRGLRQISERLCDWPELARALQLEIDLPDQWSARERAALLRKLGEVCRHRLRADERALRAYEAALDSDPRDLESLRELEQLHESREEWDQALDLYEREIEILDRGEPERRQQAWLRVGELAGDQSRQLQRAARGYELAAEIGTLSPAHRRAWADVYDQMGERRRFAEVFESWCDDPEAEAQCSDHLALVEVLVELGSGEAALARADRAIVIDPDNALAWDTAARLHEARGERSQASESLQRAGELLGGSQGADRLVQAALLVDERRIEHAAELLRRAVEIDAASASAQAYRARTAAELGRFEEAELASGSALDLASAGIQIESELQLEIALVGGRAAREQGRLESAARFYAAALALSPENVEALEAQSEVLFDRGDLRGARETLEALRSLPEAQPQCARHLSMLGATLEFEGELPESLARYQEALEADPGESSAHEAIVRIHEGAGRLDEAITALETWAECERSRGNSSGCAENLLRAAKLELTRDCAEAAEERLRQAVQAHPQQVEAQLRLTRLLWDGNRREQALEAATEAIEALAGEDCPEAPSELWLIRARSLEQRGDQRGAIEAYGRVIEGDARCCEAALSRGRLLRSLGDWREAAETLETFAEAHPEPNSNEMARVFYKRGRLLAGPLEDVRGAIRCYERAVEIDPEFTRAREPLATLLGLVPEAWRDAVQNHRALLQRAPARASSLRSLLQIAQLHASTQTVTCGLALLRALGLASPEERDRSPDALPLRLGRTARFDDPLWEKLRRVVQNAAQDLAQALGSSKPQPPSDEGGEAQRAFWALLREAEAELTAPFLASLPVDELARTLRSLVGLALGSGSVTGDAPVATALDRSLGRWTRRKLRKTLDDTSADDIAGIDFEAWQAELRTMAAVLALDRCNGDLRTALTALVGENAGQTPDTGTDAREDIPEMADITALVAGSPVASRLLERVVVSWCDDIADAG